MCAARSLGMSQVAGALRLQALSAGGVGCLCAQAPTDNRRRAGFAPGVTLIAKRLAPRAALLRVRQPRGPRDAMHLLAAIDLHPHFLPPAPEPLMRSWWRAAGMGTRA